MLVVHSTASRKSPIKKRRAHQTNQWQPVRHTKRLRPVSSVVWFVRSRKRLLSIVIVLALTLGLTYVVDRTSLYMIKGDRSSKWSTDSDFSGTLSQILGTIHLPFSVLEHYNSDQESSVMPVTFYSPLVSELSKYFDIRLAPVLSLALFRQHLESAKEHPYKTPFSWNSWLDLDNRMLLKQYLQEPPLSSCKRFKTYYNIEGDIPCEDTRTLGFSITGPVDKSLPVSARRLIAASYLAHGAETPARVMFLNVNEEHYETVVMPTIACQDNHRCLLDMALNYVNRESRYCRSNYCETGIYAGLNFAEELSKLSRLLSKSKSITTIGPDSSVPDTETVLMKGKRQSKIFLNKHNFTLDARIGSKINSLMKQSHTLLDSKLVRDFANINVINPPKYFHEAFLSSKNHNGAHYDWRFFNRALHDDYERSLILHRLTKAWLTFTEQAGITSWLAHGTLLGYYFNGMNMPFDGDLDVTVTLDSLLKLALNYNKTLVVDTSRSHNLNQSLGIGSYLIDVNPDYLQRTKNNGQNTIDARFICTYSGLYIDITAIASTIDHSFNKRSLKNFRKEFNQMLDPEYQNQIGISTLDGKAYNRRLDQLLSTLVDKKEIYNCKNNHFYKLDDLVPLRERCTSKG